MKKRIVALILTVVMSVLALVSCGSYDFVKEDLTSYAEFDLAKFMEALQKLEIEDGEFTTDDTIREAITDATVYNNIVDKIIAQTKEDQQVKTGKLDAGDVLYFVYYALDKDGNMFSGLHMNPSSLTSTSKENDVAIKDMHVVRLDDYLDGKNDAFLKLVAESVTESLKNIDDISDYIYTALTKTELETKAEEALKETKPDATTDEIKNAKAEAVKVKAGDTLYISYTISYPKTDAEGKETVVKQKATYELVTLDAENAFHKAILDATSANVGGTVTTANPIELTETKEDAEVKVTYTDVKILWKVENAGKAIATFQYTPYEKVKDDDKKEVTPDNLYANNGKVDLIDKALTYYVFPVYGISAPSYEEITAADLLYYINGSSIADNSYDAFKNVTGLEDLLKDVKSIFATTEKDNKFYADGTNLKTLLDAYNAVGGSNPTTEQKTANTKAKEALTDAQNAELKAVAAKIAALDGGKVGEAVLAEYRKDTKESLKDSYNSDIVSKVREEVLELIYSSVKVTGYPVEVLEEYKEHIYEEYEYKYYTGKFDNTTSNVKKYATLQEYLEATLKVKGDDKIDEAIEKQAKEALEPIIKIYVVSKALEEQAVKAMVGPDGYIEADINGGAYEIDEQAYRDYYGEDADKKIAEARKAAEENIKGVREESGMFLIDANYMRRYKREVGSSYYRQQIKAYGEINLRTALQFNKLFYYLTCTELVKDADGLAEIKYTTGDNVRIDFRTVDYVIVESK